MKIQRRLNPISSLELGLLVPGALNDVIDLHRKLKRKSRRRKKNPDGMDVESQVEDLHRDLKRAKRALSSALKQVGDLEESLADMEY